MRGFKEDFESWRQSLTPDERQTLHRQATGQFNKPYRKTDEHKELIIDQGKQDSLRALVQKFLDQEADEWHKNRKPVQPDRNFYNDRGEMGPKSEHFEYWYSCEEVDRDGMRRYDIATYREMEAEQKGELWPWCSPRMDAHWILNNCTESNHKLRDALKSIKRAYKSHFDEHPNAWPPGDMAEYKKFLDAPEPSVGANYVVEIPDSIMYMLRGGEKDFNKTLGKNDIRQRLEDFEATLTDQQRAIFRDQNAWARYSEGMRLSKQQFGDIYVRKKSGNEVMTPQQRAYADSAFPLNDLSPQQRAEFNQIHGVVFDAFQRMTNLTHQLFALYAGCRDSVEKDMKATVDYYAGQKTRNDPSVTQADVIEEMYAICKDLERTGDLKDVPPLDPEELKPFKSLPAIRENHAAPWGWISKMYKSTAKTTMGENVFLGIFETKEEAKACYDKWIIEYADERRKLHQTLKDRNDEEMAIYEQTVTKSDGHKRMGEQVAEAKQRSLTEPMWIEVQR